MSAALTPTDPPLDLLRDALSRHGRVRVRARGQSMRPLLPDGSLVEIVPLPAMPRRGQVVAAERAGRLIIHRVCSSRPGRIVLRGDGALKPDPPLARAAVLGQVRRVTTPRGWQARLDSPLGRALGWLLSLRC